MRPYRDPRLSQGEEDSVHRTVCFKGLDSPARSFSVSLHPAMSTSLQHSDTDSKKDFVDDQVLSELGADEQQRSQRPPIVYSSPSAFVQSVGRRFSSIWTRRFALSLLAGQVVSLCITCTNVTTTELVNRGWDLPTTQSLFL